MRFGTFVLLAFPLASGCGGPTAPTIQRNTTTPVDQVTIISAQPPAGSTLARGSAVTLAFQFSYELVGGDTGRVVLVIQDQLGRPMNSGGQPAVSITRGTGTSELSASVTIPETTDVTAVDAFLPLVINDQRSSSHMDMVRYYVR